MFCLCVNRVLQWGVGGGSSSVSLCMSVVHVTGVWLEGGCTKVSRPMVPALGPSMLPEGALPREYRPQLPTADRLLNCARP